MSAIPERVPRRVLGLRAAQLLIVAVFLVLAAVADRPFHMDDAVFLQWARGIARHGLDPYGGSTNWYGTAEPMVSVIRNPPLFGWFLAASGSVVGWSERALHLLQLIPCAVFLTFTYLLARRWSTQPLVALGIAAGSSAFLLSSATVMPDCWAAAFWMCAVYGWCGPPDSRATIVAIAALTAAAMTKWYGLALAPLLLAWELLDRRRFTPRTTLLLVPLIAALVVDQCVRAMHGASLLGWAATAARADQGAGVDLLMRSAIGLAFLGGTCVGALLLVPVLVRAHARICLGALACAILVTFVATTRLGAWPHLARASHANAWIISIQLGLLSGGGFLLLALVLRGARASTEGRFLALWVLGIFVFAAFVNWSILARSYLPLLPAVGIVVARTLDSIPFTQTTSGRIAIASLLGVAGAFGLLLLHADTEVALEARRSAELARPRGAERVWFQGHWGFQHYAGAAGALALDRARDDAAVGDVVVVPMLNTNVFGVDPERVETLERRTSALRSPILVLGPVSGAGFWSHTLGPLPFAWNLGDVSETFVFRRTR